MTTWLRWGVTASILGSIAVSLAGCGAAGRPHRHAKTDRSVTAPKQRGRGSMKGSPGQPNTTRGLHVMGFAVNSRHASYAAVSSQPQLLSEVAPFWYSVQKDGSLKMMKNPTTLSWVKKHRIPLMPLFNNAMAQYDVLLTPKLRTTTANNITQLVLKNGYDGASVDFQGLPNKATVRNGLDAFVTQLATDLHKNHKRLTVNLIPTGQATASNGAYNEAVLAKNADQIILMAYDKHSSGSPAGPVAPITWVRSAVHEAMARGVKPGQIYLGVANYGYDWVKGTTKATTVGYSKVQAMHAHPIWDAASGEYHFTYTKGGKPHVVWYEGTRSLAQKVDLARVKHLHGIAIWRLGYENAAYWKTLGHLIGTPPKVGRPKPHASPKTVPVTQPTTTARPAVPAGAPHHRVAGRPVTKAPGLGSQTGTYSPGAHRTPMGTTGPQKHPGMHMAPGRRDSGRTTKA